MSAILKAQYQARINAATTAMKPLQLAMLRVIGEKLGCDMANLNTVAPQVADTASAGTSLNDLSYMAKALPSASAGSDTASVSFPFDVRQGDIVYVNDCGNAFLNAPHDIQARVVTSAGANYLTVLNQNTMQYVAEDGFSQLYVPSPYSFNGALSITLSDGNKLLAFPYYAGSTSGGLTYTVFDKDYDVPLKKADIPITDHAGYCNNLTIVAFKKTGTNTYRLYFKAPATGGGESPAYLYYIGLTYTPANQTLTVTTARTQLFNANGQDIKVQNAPGLSDDVLLFVYWTGTKYSLVSVDLVTSAVFVYTNVNAAGDITRAMPITVSDGVKRYLLWNGSAAWLVREGVDVVETLPTGLLAELTTGLVSVALLNGNGLLLSRSTVRYVRLVVFSNDATAVTVHTVLPSYGTSNDAITLGAYCREGAEYIFPSRLRMSWDGTVAAPTLLSAIARPLSPIIHKTGQSLYGPKCLALYPATADSTNYFLAIYRATAGCFAYMNSVPMFEVLATAAASTPAAVRLLNAVTSISSRGVPHAPALFGFRSLAGKGHSPYYDKRISGTYGASGTEEAYREMQRTRDYTGLASGKYPAVTGLRVYPNGGVIKGLVTGTSSTTLGVIELNRKFSNTFTAGSTAFGFFDISTNMPVILFGVSLTSYIDGENL